MYEHDKIRAGESSEPCSGSSDAVNSQGGVNRSRINKVRPFAMGPIHRSNRLEGVVGACKAKDGGMGATRMFVARDKEAPNAEVCFSRASRTQCTFRCSALEATQCKWVTWMFQ